tara:strand:+ start:419 stop:1174 length:756 start_codon:yes stop_codon:yes gene_type:complete
MKINVLLSCDENPYYFDFWEQTKNIWEKRMGIDPKLIFINSERQTESFEDGILYIKKLDKYPVHLQAQLARLYFAQSFKDDICLASDIDMFPASRKFFDVEKIVKNCDRDTFFHLNPERREFGQLPICYYCGYGSLFKRLFDDMTWEQFLEFIVNKDFNTDKFNFKLPPHLADKKLWFSDEIFIFSSILDHNIKIRGNDKIIQPAERLDRESILSVNYLSLMDESIVDIHLPRPYQEFKQHIDKVYDALMV